MTTKNIPLTYPITETGSSSGTLASRPAASSVSAGHVYFATDVGLYFVSIVTKWLQAEVESAGGTPSGSAGGDLTGSYPNPTLNANQDANARVGVRKNSAGSTFKRRRVNLIEGSNVTLTVADDATDEEVDVTIAASGGGGSVASDTIWDAKGDLAVGSGSDAADNLGVGSNGDVLTADSAQTLGVKWAPVAGGGLVAKLYDFTVTGSDKASIDTNVDGTTVANFAGYDMIEVYMLLKTDDAADGVRVFDCFVNNSNSAVYDTSRVRNLNSTVGGGSAVGDTRWQLLCGSGTSYRTMIRMAIYDHTNTSFFKAGIVEESYPSSTAANNFITVRDIGYAATTAISRLKIACQSTAKFKVGSRLVVYGT